MPIHDLGPGELSGRGLERAHDALELSRSKRERAFGGAGDAAGSELERTSAAGALAASSSRTDATTSSPSGDRVELSIAARALSAGEDEARTAQRGAQNAAMKSALDAGELATPERIARAAQRLLGG
jgi:hypothetical protein